MTAAHAFQDMNFASGQTDLPVGEILRRARLQLGLTVEDVESQLKIKASQIQALEEMNFDAFSGWVYVTGFVKSYADFLGLDGNKVLLLLKNQTGRHNEKQELNIPEPDSEKQMPDMWIIMSAVAALVLIIGAVFIFQSFSSSSVSEEAGIPEIQSPYASIQSPENVDMLQPENTGYSDETQIELDQIVEDTHTEETVEPPQDVEDVAGVVDTQNGAPVPAPKPTYEAPVEAERAQAERVQAAADETHRIIINVNEKSWVEIRDATGTKVVSRVLNPGDSFFVPEDANRMSMTTGNAAGIELVVDGRALGALGQKGEIRRNIPLEPESLKEMFSR